MPEQQSTYKLSRTILAVIGALALIGFIAGINSYIHRPATFTPNDPAANAIVVHILLAIASLIAVTGIQTYRARKHLPSIWLAPFSTKAMLRLRRTFLPHPLTIVSILRIIPCAIILYMLLWEPYRAAMQIVGALDPAFTANAWGGPSYLGASLAHWLDDLLLFYGSAYVLSLLLVRAPHSK